MSRKSVTLWEAVVVVVVVAVAVVVHTTVRKLMKAMLPW
jgi:hypothetical protein